MPVIASVAAVTLWELPRVNTQVISTPDGRMLGLNCDWIGGGVRSLRVWDLTRRRTLLSVRSAFRSASLSPDGETLLVVESLTTSVYQVRTGKQIAIFESAFAPEHRKAFSSDGGFVAVLQDGTTRVWELPAWRSRGVLQFDTSCSAVAISADGTMIAVSRDDGEIELWNLVERQRVGTVSGSTDVRSLAFSPDGQRLVAAGRRVEVWDLETQTKQMIFKPSMPAAHAVFAPDGLTVAVMQEGAGLALLGLDPGRDDGTWREVGHFLFLPVAFAGDSEYLMSAGPHGSVRIVHRRTMARRTLRPASPRFITVSVLVGVVFAAWIIAWVLRREERQHAYRPFFDLLLVWAIFLTAVALRIFGTGSIYDVYRPALHFGMICFVCCIVFVVIWAVLGTARVSVRAPGLIGLCALTMAPMLLWQDFDWYLWQVILGVIALTSSLIGFLKIWQVALGCHLVQIAGDVPAAAEGLEPIRHHQFSVRDLLLWTTAIAVVVGVTMHFNPTYMPRDVWLFAVLEGIGAAAVAAVSCWLALGNRMLPLRIGLWGIVVIQVSTLQLLFSNNINLVAPGWTAAQPGVMGLLVTASLLVFRYHGYRLKGRDVSGKALAAGDARVTGG